MTWGVSDLEVRFGETVALNAVDFEAAPATVHAVVGGDGAGKSTLLKVLAGLDLGQAGAIRLPGRGKTGFVPSDGGVFRDLTVRENVEFVASAYRLRNWEDRAGALLRRAGLAEFPGRLAGRLSGGQRRKLAGSLALLPEPELVILDELTTGLDPVSRVEVWRLLAGAAADGAAVVVATTYLDEAARAHRVSVMHRGTILLEGDPGQVAKSIPGRVVDLDRPDDEDLAWRRGSGWRQWLPDAEPSAVGDDPGIEDAAIVAELIAEGAGR